MSERRRVGARIGLLLALLGLPACAAAPAPRSPLVLVVIDTLRRDHLGVFGGEARTPNLDALARRGVARAALASFHQTSMSMGALFTGRTPSLESGDASAPLRWQPSSWCGMGRFGVEARSDACLPPGLPTLGEALSRRGYVTLGVVANSLLHDPAGFSRGFSRWAEVGAEPAGEAGPLRARSAARLRGYEHVHRALRVQLEDLPEAPLFVYLHYLDVHDWLHLGRSYTESVELMDRGIGELQEILHEHGLLADATLLVTADHGELVDDRPRVLPWHPLHLGNPSYRDVLDVPFLLVGAGDVALPETIRSQDVHGILLSLAGRADETPADLAPGELLVSEKLFRTYQQGRFKSFWPRGDGAVLVDLEGDPGETRDVAALHPEVLAQHRRRVDALSASLAATGLPTDAAGAATPSGAAPLDPQWAERLRSLGYLE